MWVTECGEWVRGCGAVVGQDYKGFVLPSAVVILQISIRFLEFDVLITASTRACTVEPSALSPRVVCNFMVKYF